jgi:predicted acyltransferase
MFGNWNRKITWTAVIGFLLLCLVLMAFKIGDFGTMRIPGVLQRIGIVYAIISLLYIFTSIRTQIVCFSLILIGYWLLMGFVPVPNGNVANFEKAINFASWVDSIVLKNHVWVQTKTWDPEGILSTLPAIATGLAGIFAGFLIKENKDNPKQLVIGLISIGFVAVIYGLVWNEVFPINKSLWTSSYVLYVGGLAAICFAIFYLLIDVWGFKTMAMPFVFFGVNAMTVFFGSGLIPRVLSGIHFLDETKETNLKEWIYQHGIIPFFQDPINASLTGAIVFLLIWFFILWIMYKNKIFVKV